jgi:hypothetical protein
MKNHTGIEQRRFKRTEYPLKVRFRIVKGENKNIFSRFIEGEVRDISLGGIFLQTDFLEVDGLHVYHNSNTIYQNVLDISIELPFGNDSIRVMGKVAWYDLASRRGKYQYDAGISFTEISEKHQKILNKFLDRFSGKD